MNYGIQVGDTLFAIGKMEILKYFFANAIGHNPEESRYSTLINDFYQKHIVTSENVDQLLLELETLKSDFEELPPKSMISTVHGIPFEDIVPCNTDADTLAEYFLTSEREDLIETLEAIFLSVKEGRGDFEFVELTD